MSAISIKGLTKVYKTKFPGPTGSKELRALHHVDMEVKEGDFFALLGANGAGKTTIIGILTGIVMKTSGTVSVCGHDLDTDTDAAKACIGVVPQEFNLNIFETSKNIVLDQAGFYGVPRREALKRMEEIFKALGLWDKRDQYSRVLSGGMKRRLMIARALMHRPKILLLDEPTAGVDVELRRSMWDYLKTLNAAGTTIVLTTHYLEEVEEMCRNVVILKKGEKAEDTSVANLLGSLPSQTYRVALDTDVANVNTSNLRTTPLDARTVTVELDAGQSVTDMTRIFTDAGAKVLDIRPTANRIEKAFLDITNAV